MGWFLISLKSKSGSCFKRLLFSVSLSYNILVRLNWRIAPHVRFLNIKFIWRASNLYIRISNSFVNSNYIFIQGFHKIFRRYSFRETQWSQRSIVGVWESKEYDRLPSTRKPRKFCVLLFFSRPVAGAESVAIGYIILH